MMPFQTMRTAIFGGTFDPIHSAHLIVAHEAAEAFALDRVLFIPAANPPHKEAGAPYEDRFRMVELACAADPRFHPSRLEEGRAGTGPPRPSKIPGTSEGSTEAGSVVPGSSMEKSYSILTIERLKAPGETLFFIIGADAFAEIRSWRRWEDVVQGVEFIVVTRPGHVYDSPPGARVFRLETIALPVSSSEIRQELSQGLTPSDLPPAVAEYIHARGLYRSPQD
jgi:nicotinate-nucleotide adenylyltransferase